MGATVDLERVAPQWSKRYRDQSGMEKIRVARIDAVATIPGLNEAAMVGRHDQEANSSDEHGGIGEKREDTLQHKGKEKKRRSTETRNEVGPDTVKPISIELGGRMGPQTVDVLQNLTTKWQKLVVESSTRRRLSGR